MPLAVKNCSACSISFENIRTPLAIGALVVAATATFFAVGGLLSYYKVLPNTISWIDRGPYGNWGIGLTGIAFWILSLALLKKKADKPSSVQDIIASTKASNPITKGKIIIKDVNASGALGNRPQDLTAFSDKTAQIKRIDGKEWKNNPREILVLCEITDSQGLKHTPYYLPLSLFIEENGQIKKDKDHIQFDYIGIHYDLEIAQKQETRRSFFNEVVPAIVLAYNEKEGKPIVYSKTYESERDQTTYPCLLEANFTIKQKDSLTFLQFLKNLKVENPSEMLYRSNGKELEITISDRNNIKFFVGETMFGLIDSSQLSLRVFRYDFDDTYSKEKIQPLIESATYKDGFLTIPLT